MAVDIPHFGLPFRFDPGTIKAVVVDQDSQDDVAVCVESILRYRKGQRPEAPDFGIADATFLQELDGAELLGTIEEQEPRAAAALVQYEDDLDRLQSLADGINVVRIALGIAEDIRGD